MTASDDFRRCLVECDIAGVRKLWAHVSPRLPQPADDREALVVVHRARTEAHSIPLRLRAYSHRWLLDHGYPSGLPDELRPAAERVYPVVVGAVGIAALVPKSYTPIVQGVMRDAVMEAYADNRKDPIFVRENMMAARRKELKKLGILGLLSLVVTAPLPALAQTSFNVTSAPIAATPTTDYFLAVENGAIVRALVNNQTYDRHTDQHFEIDKGPASNFFGKAFAGPVAVFQFFQDEPIVAGSAPAMILNNQIVADGLVSLPGTSNSFWPGLQVIQTKQGDGSAISLNFSGQLEAIGAVGYNEGSGLAGIWYNIGSTNGYISAIEVGAFDSINGGAASWKTKLHGVIGRVAKYNTTWPSTDHLNSNSFMATSEGTQPVGAVLYAYDIGTHGFDAGIDLSATSLASGYSAIWPTLSSMGWKNTDSGVIAPVMGVDGSDNVWLRPAVAAGHHYLADFSGNVPFDFNPVTAALKLGRAGVLGGSLTIEGGTSGETILQPLAIAAGTVKLPPVTGGLVAILCKSGASVSAPADTSEDNLASCTVPANTLGANGRLRITAGFVNSGAGGAKTMTIRYSGTSGIIVQQIGTTDANPQVFGIIANKNATNSQTMTGQWVITGSTGINPTRNTGTIDTTASTVVAINCQKASSGDVCTLDEYLVELLTDGA